jgi:hypothetical protein
METRICRGCGQEKAIGEFNYRVKAKGLRQRYCRLCTRGQVKAHYVQNTAYYLRKARKRNNEVKKRNQDRILAYLASHSCVDCGESDWVCLQFDHVRGRKLRTIAVMVGTYEWERIEEEIAKCEVRCANCHQRKTAKQRGYYKLFGRARRP